ncbi:MAG TPA: GNAT family N-acetyltransferase [Tepidisphaeraceae bacterium]
MSNLSPNRNVFTSGDATATPPVGVRKASKPEIHGALRVILGSAAQLASDAQVVDFLRFALYRGINLDDLWLVDRRGQVAWAVLPVVSPGRTMVLFSPPHVAPTLQDTIAPHLIGHVLDEFRSRGTVLAQVLIDPADVSVISLYGRCGFQRLAELLYFNRDLRRHEAPTLPGRFHVITYSPERHNLFARAISATYTDSLDCPALNGRRDVEDIIAGHKAVGNFDASTWLMLLDRDEPLGVSLLNRSPHSEAMEIVYFGLVPLARGRGMGDLLMQQTLHTSVTANAKSLTLAVDSENVPALKLYKRYGLKEVCSRVAMMKDLREADRTPLPSMPISSKK